MNIALQPRPPLRAEDLARPGMPEKFCELREGELALMTPAGFYHNWIATNIVLMFRAFCEERRDLLCGSDNEGFLIERDPDTLLSPDACLFRRRPEPDGPWMEFAPEIAVEVLSASNTTKEMDWKRGKLFARGCEQFWVLDPAVRSLSVHLADGRVLEAREPEVLRGEGIAEGLELRLEEIFRRP